MDAEDDVLILNGLNGETGEYFTPPMSRAEAQERALGRTESKDHLTDLRWRKDRKEGHLGVKEGVDPTKLLEAGWGVIFAPGTPEGVKDALRPLLNFRKSQAGDLYREISGAAAPQPGETKFEFLQRSNAGGGGAVDPKRMPYYLMLVASPEEISYEFQYQIDVQYAVGRLHFETPREYAHYAASVVAAERGEVVLPRRAIYFGVQNPNDKSTLLSNQYLLGPLAEWTKQDQSAWTVNAVQAEAATRARLAGLLGGEETPAFLFTASHGMGLPPGHKAQERLGGALCCQDWPGPGTTGKTRDYYFAGEDLPSSARVDGMIAMMYACFGLGTPDKDDFGQKEKAMFAPRPLISDLPRKLLSQGALAVIGHVDLAWDYSFRFKGSTPHRQVFESMTKRLLEGHPVGSAMEYFNSRYAELSSDLTPILQKAEAGRNFSEADLRVFLTRNDARNYAVLGDPAVRLPVGDVSTPKRETPLVVRLPVAADPLFAAEQVSMGWGETISDVGDGLEASVRKMAGRMGETLERVVESILTLEVATYVADDLAQVTYGKGKIDGARLRALSLVSIDGGIKVVLPEKDGKVDAEVWEIHKQAMERAMANRNEMVKLAASAITGLLGAGGAKK